MHDTFNQHPDDHEAKMARADLFKCAQYSFKLFKMIHEDMELEGWVQAKITKAADYIASVYHYMEYEMKISEYGENLENADMYSESIRRVFEQKLMEAKKQAEKVKATESKCSGCGKPMPKCSCDDKIDEEKSSTGGEITKTKTGLRHTHNPDRFTDEPHAEPASKAKSKSAAEKAGDKAHDKAQEKDSRAWGKANPGKQTIMKGGVKTTNEAAKPDFLDMDKDGNKKEPMKKAVADKKAGPKKGVNPFAKVKEQAISGAPQKSGIPATATTTVPGMRATQQDLKKAGASAVLGEGKCNHTPKGKPCPVHGLKECSGMYEASHQEKTTMKHVKNPTAGEKAAAKDIKSGTAGYADRVAMLKSAEKDGRLKEAGKPSAGMSAGAKSALAKKASAGKDIGKPGKSFDKVAKAAGSGEKGKKIAAAAMWKNAAR